MIDFDASRLFINRIHRAWRKSREPRFVDFLLTVLDGSGLAEFDNDELASCAETKTGAEPYRSLEYDLAELPEHIVDAVLALKKDGKKIPAVKMVMDCMRSSGTTLFRAKQIVDFLWEQAQHG